MRGQNDETERRWKNNKENDRNVIDKGVGSWGEKIISTTYF